ncbi:hypothetical protein ABEH22_08175 [Pantoea agglomerans]|uniref:hypothetical protein n=1 Tax=Enterobacter agglomerans TaxID=549 RepID=UPI0032093ECE
MSPFTILAVYGMSSDSSSPSYIYPHYFILDSRSGLILEYVFTNATEAINHIYYLEGQEQSYEAELPYIPAKTTIDIINITYKLQNELCINNNHLHHSIQESLTNAIKKHIKKNRLTI